LSELLRKVLHATAPAFSAFFLIPLDRDLKLAVYLILLALVLLFEAVRIAYSLRIPGLREYESRRPAAYAQFAIALAIIYAFGDLRTSLIALTLLAVVDPVASWSRGSRLYPALPFLAGLTPTLLLMASCAGLTPLTVAMSLIVASSAVVVESVHTGVVDDDFLIPATALLLSECLC